MKDSWIPKVGMLLVALLIVWNIYKGVTVQEIGFPGFTFKFGTSSAPSALTGTWKYEMISDVSRQTLTGYMDLTADGIVITGEMDNPDRLNVGQKSAVKGTYVNGALSLTRDTNHEGIMQEYRLFPKGHEFSGTFRNSVPEGYYKDSGIFRIHR